MTSPELRAAGEELLIRSLYDGLAIAKAIKDRDYVALAGASALAAVGPPSQLALADPLRYRRLRKAITLFYAKGYEVLDIEALLKLASGAGSGR
ncbi:MAG: hypothetical protein U1E28_18685 [Beijerinckiaceae bacterium]